MDWQKEAILRRDPLFRSWTCHVLQGLGYHYDDRRLRACSEGLHGCSVLKLGEELEQIISPIQFSAVVCVYEL